MKIKADYANAPQWKETTIKSSLPKELKCLDEIAHNMWWAWNYEGRDLFKSLDPDLYEKCNANPVLLLERLSYDRKEAIVKDKETMAKVKNVYKMFREYMDVKPNAKRPSVAYFCMEYGINQVVKIYSGGLGMLAGDYLKEASDSNVDMCAVGFLYRYGYFKQSLSMDGQQIANYDAQNFNSLPIERVYDENGNPLVVDVPYTNYQVHAYVWQMNVGRIKLYLLDTDNDMNSEFDRPITHSLYGGDWENRLKQEILLGIGGMLDRNGLRPARYTITKNDMMVVASEVGVMDFDPTEIAEKGRLQPGKILLIDTQEGKIYYDGEIKERLAAQHPYRQWLNTNRIELEKLRSGRKVENGVDNLTRKELEFGFGEEDIDGTIIPMATKGQEPTASMGNDTPLAVLSDQPQIFFNYFRQQFAQVTNPAIDSIRENLVMSLTEYIGRVGSGILNPDESNCKMVRLPHPILTNTQLDILQNIRYKGFNTVKLHMLFETAKGEEGLHDWSAQISGGCGADMAKPGW